MLTPSESRPKKTPPRIGAAMVAAGSSTGVPSSTAVVLHEVFNNSGFHFQNLLAPLYRFLEETARFYLNGLSRLRLATACKA